VSAQVVRNCSRGGCDDRDGKRAHSRQKGATTSRTTKNNRKNWTKVCCENQRQARKTGREKRRKRKRVTSSSGRNRWKTKTYPKNAAREQVLIEKQKEDRDRQPSPEEKPTLV